MDTMLFLARFVAAFVIASAATVGGSMVWPKVTNRPRPQVLTRVYEEVGKTEFGQRIENVLGVSDESSGPIDIASVSGELVKTAASEVQKKAGEIVTDRVLEEVLRRYETLGDTDKEKIKESICK